MCVKMTDVPAISVVILARFTFLSRKVVMRGTFAIRKSVRLSVCLSFRLRVSPLVALVGHAKWLNVSRCFLHYTIKGRFYVVSDAKFRNPEFRGSPQTTAFKTGITPVDGDNWTNNPSYLGKGPR